MSRIFDHVLKVFFSFFFIVCAHMFYLSLFVCVFPEMCVYCLFHYVYISMAFGDCVVLNIRDNACTSFCYLSTTHHNGD